MKFEKTSLCARGVACHLLVAATFVCIPIAHAAPTIIRHITPSSGYAPTEKHFLRDIESVYANAIKNGKEKDWQQRHAENMKRWAQNPSGFPLPQLRSPTRARSWWYPVTLLRDRAHPLFTAVERYRRELIFLNGENPREVAWARVQPHDPARHIVLVAGHPKAIEKTLQQRIYFDQAASLASRWSLRHTPTRATIDRTGVHIQRIFISEEISPNSNDQTQRTQAKKVIVKQ